MFWSFHFPFARKIWKFPLHFRTTFSIDTQIYSLHSQEQMIPVLFRKPGSLNWKIEHTKIGREKDLISPPCCSFLKLMLIEYTNWPPCAWHGPSSPDSRSRWWWGRVWTIYPNPFSKCFCTSICSTSIEFGENMMRFDRFTVIVARLNVSMN